MSSKFLFNNKKQSKIILQHNNLLKIKVSFYNFKKQCEENYFLEFIVNCNGLCANEIYPSFLKILPGIAIQEIPNNLYFMNMDGSQFQKNKARLIEIEKRLLNQLKWLLHLPPERGAERPEVAPCTSCSVP